jgi:4-azaleucine resistance transporter AzlC
MMRETAIFSSKGYWRGARLCLPIAASVFAYGTVFGMLSGQAGLSVSEALLMSGLVFAGSSQFVALEMWRQPLPMAAILLTTLVLNLRHVLMGAALSPWFKGVNPWLAYGSVFFMTDENWALTMKEFDAGERDRAFLAGSGLTIFLAWTGATLTGLLLGNVIPDPVAFGLDFAFTAVFTALLVGMWKGRQDWLPWLVAGVFAVAAAHWLPGKWYILIGGLAGSLAGAVQDGR